jgi:hypothetical protein
VAGRGRARLSFDLNDSVYGDVRDFLSRKRDGLGGDLVPRLSLGRNLPLYLNYCLIDFCYYV